MENEKIHTCLTNENTRLIENLSNLIFNLFVINFDNLFRKNVYRPFCFYVMCVYIVNS